MLVGAGCSQYARDPGRNGSRMVVVGVRADFYRRCLNYPELAAALQDRQMVLGPMTAQELRKAVTSPAEAVGLQLEAGLVELMLRDLGVSSGPARAGVGRRSYDAGAPPLLSHAVLSTWQRREGTTLTISGYRAAGGIQLSASASRTPHHEQNSCLGSVGC